MKIGQETIDDLKGKSRPDKKVGPPRPGPVGRLTDPAFQRADHRCPDCHDSSTVRPGLGDLLNRFIRNAVMLGVHRMGVQRAWPQRTESPDPDMESDERDPDTVLFQTTDQILCQVESGRGSRHRTGMTGIDRLVAMTIVRMVIAAVPDIRRKWHFSMIGQVLGERDGTIVHPLELSGLFPVANTGQPPPFRQKNLGERSQSTAQKPDDRIRFFRQKQYFHFFSGRGGAEHPGRNDPGIVQYQKVSGLETRRKIGHQKGTPRRFAISPTDRQKSAFFPVGRRKEPDPVRRKIVMIEGRLIFGIDIHLLQMHFPSLK